jgi:hypothetical protein
MPTNSEHQLDASHDFVDLFENGALGLHFVGADGIILNANQAELDSSVIAEKNTSAITSHSSMSMPP